MTIAIRPVRHEDAAAIAAIYTRYVDETVITFEEEAPDAAEIARRIAEATRTHPWLVAEADGAIVGYAYARPFHPRAAYRWTCETSIYLAMDARGRGIGRPLYDALLETCTRAGFVAAIGLVTVPNPESERFHAATGFAAAGRLARVGWKHGAWHDVGYFERDLAPRAAPPAGTTPPDAG